MSISFNTIPVDIRTPGQYVEIDNSGAVEGLSVQPHKILVLGQRLAGGTVGEAVPTQILSAGQAEEAFGRGSMLAEMLKALKKLNRRTECWAIALDDDAAGVEATGSITISGAATAAGTLNVYIAGTRIRVAVAAGDDEGALASALSAAINDEDTLPVTSATSATQTSAMNVDLTARHKGESGNDIDIRVNYHQGESTPEGVTLSITNMSGGAGNPDVSTAISVFGDTWYNTIVMPWTDAANLTVLETELESRWSGTVMKEGQAFAGSAGTYGAMSTFGSTRNSPFLTVLGAGKSPHPPWIWAAVCAAVDAAEEDPARPRQGLVLTGLLPAAQSERLTRDERDLLLHDGISTTVVDAAGRIVIERLITTYQTNSAGVEDTSYLDLTTMRTLSYLRYTLRTRIALRYPRHKLADDGTLVSPGQAIVTPLILRAEVVGLAHQWEQNGLVENVGQFTDELIVERDANDPNRINAVIPPDIINQLRIFAASIRFRL